MSEQLDFFPPIKTKIIQGDCLEIMKTMDANSIDFIVTDPPYGLKFMGKDWDHGIPGVPFWQEALRVCKPGAMMAAFGGTRTYHRITCAIEDAEWEIRDCIMWIYGSGFPKSHNHFGFEGYGTALKPAYEPIILAMKPLEGTFKQNAEKWGVAGINIDESRIGTSDATGRPRGPQQNCYGKYEQITTETHPKGRWPANVIFDEEAAEMLDEKSGISKSANSQRNNSASKNNCMSGANTGHISFGHNDSGGASRFFYCAKASSSERNEGLEGMPIKQTMGGGRLNNTEDDVCGKYGSIKAAQHNSHPTVKPLSLMKYILKLLAPPGNPTCLDPFCGSGSTLLAAKELGINCIGIEKEEEYCEIARKRCE